MVVRLVVVMVSAASRFDGYRSCIDCVDVRLKSGFFAGTFRRGSLLLLTGGSSCCHGRAEVSSDKKLFIERMLLGRAADPVKNRRSICCRQF